MHWCFRQTENCSGKLAQFLIPYRPEIKIRLNKGGERGGEKTEIKVSRRRGKREVQREGHTTLARTFTLTNGRGVPFGPNNPVAFSGFCSAIFYFVINNQERGEGGEIGGER